MARTAACAPARRAISPRSSGRRTAALFMATLSAPARRIAAASSTESIPPPTQKGIESAAATRAARSTVVRRRSAEAVMSRKTSSSAPSWSYRAASPTGSPASRRSTNRVPFTTRPSFTSRQGMIRLASTSGRRRAHEPSERAKPHRPALLGMELQSEEPVGADRRGERRPVLDRRDDRAGIQRLRDVRVHEVEVGGIGQRGEPGVHSSPAHAIPTGVRDAHGTSDPPHLAREDPEPGCRGVFLAPFEEKLHPDAEAEERDAPFADRRDREVEAEPPQLAGAVAEVADTGKDDRPRGEGLGLGPRDAHVRRAGASQSALNAGEVADTVVEDRDHPMRPFELGTPTRRGSRRDATSRALPSALHVAPRRRWVLPPRSCHRWLLQPAPASS